MSVKQDCLTRVSSKSVVQECQVTQWEKKCQVRSVRQEVSSKSVLQECQVRVSYKSLKKECPTRVSSKKCQVRSVK